MKNELADKRKYLFNEVDVTSVFSHLTIFVNFTINMTVIIENFEFKPKNL